MNNSAHSNTLINETSPYLLQHAQNPVDWYPWADFPFKNAEQEDKLVIVSVGYSACHWCHVMEKESFNDEEVAMVMNDNFVSIKVDKEERPDVDQQYMSAVRIITGTGGWPLNVICLPDGRPIYGGTYFPRHQWLAILEQLAELYKTNKEKLYRAANDLEEGVRSVDFIEGKLPGLTYLPKYLRLIVETWRRKFDTKWGGTLATPKFPMPAAIEFLLSYAYHMQDDTIKDQALLTLDKIYEGGIYDHVGGGFHRYSVDGEWFLPHFEKMLYDNAQLSLTYAHGYQYTKDERYKSVAVETLEFLLRDFYTSDKLFYSAMDADSDAGEGKYYMWRYHEIQQILDDDTNMFCDRFGIKCNGNIEDGENILSIKASFQNLALRYRLSEDEVEKRIALSLRKLFCGRFLREKPLVDTKVIVAWNAMAIKTFALSSSIFNEPRYLVVAIDAIKRIEDKYIVSGSLYRSVGDNGRAIKGMLDDYAYLIDAYIALYSATFDFSYIIKAKGLVEICFRDFYDDNSGMFYYTSGDVTLPMGRKMDMVDGVSPSSNSSLARSLYFLSLSLSNSTYKDVSVQMLANMQDQMSGAGPFIANWGMLLLNLTFAPAEVTIVGKDALKDKRQMDTDYLPNVFFFGAKEKSDLPIFKNRWNDGKTTIHLCIDNVCRYFDGSIHQLKENALEVRNCYIL